MIIFTSFERKRALLLDETSWADQFGVGISRLEFG